MKKMKKAYYGFKVQHGTAEMLEEFKHFNWTGIDRMTGFLGIEIKANEKPEKQFLELIDNYSNICEHLRNPNAVKLLKKLQLLKNQETTPSVFLDDNQATWNNKIFSSFENYIEHINKEELKSSSAVKRSKP